MEVSLAKILFPEIDLNGVKAVLLDLDNSLYLYEPCHQHALKKCFDQYPLNISFEKFCETYRSCREAVVERLKPQGACRSRFFAFLLMLESANHPQAYIDALKLDKLYWDSFISVMILESDAKDFLLKCKKEEVRICLVTDMLATTQVKKIQQLQIADYVDFMVTSEEVGCEKPSPKMFETALNKLQLTKSEVIMIGDDEKKDVAGAEKFAIKAYQVKIT